MNIPIEQQLVSKDLALRMKELGYKQEGYFWLRWRGESHSIDHLDYTPIDNGLVNVCVVPTCAEMGAALPFSVSRSITYGLEYAQPVTEGFAVYYKPLSFSYSGHLCWVTAKTEANARAKAWIYLAENGLIEGLKVGG